ARWRGRCHTSSTSPRAHKKSSQKSHVPGGQRTENSSGSDWTRFTPACRADTRLSEGGDAQTRVNLYRSGREASVPCDPLDESTTKGRWFRHLVADSSTWFVVGLSLRRSGFSRIVGSEARALFV